MTPGDTVRILSDTEDRDATGVIRREVAILDCGRAYLYAIVTFADGHEGAYEAHELQVVANVPA